MTDNVKKISHAEVLGIISAWFCMIGAFFPWAYAVYFYGGISVIMGFESCGGFTLFFGIICFLLFYLGFKNRTRYKTVLGILLLGILILFLVLNEASHLGYNSDLGFGYYLTFFGSIGLLISSIWLFIDTYTSDSK